MKVYTEQEKKLPIIDEVDVLVLGHVLIYPSVFPNTVTLNMTNCIGLDLTSSGDLTKAYIFTRKHVISKALKQ